MILSHKYKFIFIKTTKTAGTSIEAYLSQFCGDDDVITPIYPAVNGHNPRNYGGEKINNIDQLLPHEFTNLTQTNTFKNHMSAKEIEALVQPDIWQNYFKFCVERNPWDKVISSFYMQKIRSSTILTFDEYLANGNLPVDTHKWFDGRTGKIMVDEILKYENLECELGRVLKRLGVPFKNGLNVREKSHYRLNKMPYRNYFTNQEMIDLVTDKFNLELSLFGYSY